jgi:hypothetical protein
MADLLPILETMENRWMRAWVGRDARTLKALTSRKFMLLVGSKPCVILDAPSWLDAATTRYLCTSYRFGDFYARDLGSVALFASELEVEATVDGQDWSGPALGDGPVAQDAGPAQLRMIERVISRPEDNPQVRRPSARCNSGARGGRSVDERKQVAQ